MLLSGKTSPLLLHMAKIWGETASRLKKKKKKLSKNYPVVYLAKSLQKPYFSNHSSGRSIPSCWTMPLALAFLPCYFSSAKSSVKKAWAEQPSAERQSTAELRSLTQPACLQQWCCQMPPSCSDGTGLPVLWQIKTRNHTDLGERTSNFSVHHEYCHVSIWVCSSVQEEEKGPIFHWANWQKACSTAQDFPTTVSQYTAHTRWPGRY